MTDRTQWPTAHKADWDSRGKNLDLFGFQFFPAIVIQNRTKRWFHDWRPHHEVKNAEPVPMPIEAMPSYIYGIPGYIGTEIPRTDSGHYLGISRTGVKIPKGFWT